MDSSLTKGLTLLGQVITLGPQRADELASATGLPVSSTYRYLKALSAGGFLEHRSGLYHPGPLLSRTTGQADLIDRIRSVCHRWLVRLMRESGETAVLTVRSDSNAIVVDSVDSYQAIRYSFNRGALRPLHAGASAKVLLAYAPEPIVTQLVASKLQSFTSRTKQGDALRDDIRTVRSRGYSISHGEVDPHAFGIGVPLRAIAGVPSLGLSIVGPEPRCPKPPMTDTLHLLGAVAKQMAADLASDQGLGPSNGQNPWIAGEVT